MIIVSKKSIKKSTNKGKAILCAAIASTLLVVLLSACTGGVDQQPSVMNAEACGALANQKIPATSIGLPTTGGVVTAVQWVAKSGTGATPVVHPYKCADGVWVMIMLFDYAKYWASFCKTLGRPDLIEDQRFKTVLHAKTNQSTLVDILAEIIGYKPYGEWAGKWQAEDIPYEKLHHIMDLLEDETAKLNHFIRPVTYPSGRMVYLPTPPIQFREMGLSDFKTTTGIGSETEEILLQLGYTAAEIDEMKASKVIRSK